MKPPTSNKNFILDLAGLVAFQKYHGNNFELKINGTRVHAELEADSRFYELSQRFNNNEPVNVLDFIHCQREIRAMMMSLKNNEKGKEDFTNGNRSR